MIASLFRYGLVSAVALAADVAMLRLAVDAGGLHYAVGASAGFAVGLVVNYALSRRAVFGATGKMAAREFALFAGVGLVTLGLTLAVMSLLVEGFGVHYLAAKAVAVGGSFLTNFLLRRRYVFGSDSQGPRIA